MRCIVAWLFHADFCRRRNTFGGSTPCKDLIVARVNLRVFPSRICGSLACVEVSCVTKATCVTLPRVSAVVAFSDVPPTCRKLLGTNDRPLLATKAVAQRCFIKIDEKHRFLQRGFCCQEVSPSQKGAHLSGCSSTHENARARHMSVRTNVHARSARRAPKWP